MSEHEFERLLELVDVLDEVQLLRLQCKLSTLIGDPPSQEPSAGDTSKATVPPPAGLGGHYRSTPPAMASVEYEELTDLNDDDEDPGGV